MPPMASSVHADFRDDATASEAYAVDRETESLLRQQMEARAAGDSERYLQLAQEMLKIRLRVYKPDSSQIGAAWCLIGSAYRKASILQEAKEATEKSLEVYAVANDGDNAALAREQLALIFEDMGQLADARGTRLRGANEGTMVCSSLQCPFTKLEYRLQNGGRPSLFKLDRLKTCGGCKSIYYCSPKCQKADWMRHRFPCKEYMAAQAK